MSETKKGIRESNVFERKKDYFCFSYSSNKPGFINRDIDTVIRCRIIERRF